jgi:hypothetical protein
MTTELKTIPFAGGEIEAAVGPGGKPFVNIRRACEELGIDYSRQLRRLREADWATVVDMSTVAGDGKERTMSFVGALALPMWMAKINPEKIKPELRLRLRAYQLEAAEVLAQAFMPKAIVAGGGVDSGALAKMAAVQSALAATIQQLTSVSEVVVEHEHRLRALEAKPVVTITMSPRTSARAMRVRFNARLREVVGAHTGLMDSSEKEEFFKEVNGGLKKAFGERDGWDAEKFIQASRWLKMNYGIDITDIAVEV